jgi:SAM-dependent methyltransferase
VHPTHERPLDGGTFDDLFDYPTTLVRQGGPRASEYSAFRDWLDRAARVVNAGRLQRESVCNFWRALGPEYLGNTLQGHALARPHGYPGDFEMMDKIYDRHVSPDPRFRAWDIFFHRQAAPDAVRNRAAYFSKVLDDAVDRTDGPIRVLDLACGSARHLAPWLLCRSRTDVEILCVDQDLKALLRAEEACSAAEGRVRFQQANVLRFAPPGQFDLIWSSGLFDYFSDATFIRALARFRQALRPDGVAVIGNFGPANPTRAYMELVGAWVLHHRSPAELVAIAAESGAPEHSITVGADATGVNLFVHVRAA